MPDQSQFLKNLSGRVWDDGAHSELVRPPQGLESVKGPQEATAGGPKGENSQRSDGPGHVERGPEEVGLDGFPSASSMQLPSDGQGTKRAGGEITHYAESEESRERGISGERKAPGSPRGHPQTR